MPSWHFSTSPSSQQSCSRLAKSRLTSRFCDRIHAIVQPIDLFNRLLDLPSGVFSPRRDGPDGFDLVAETGINAVVEIHVGIAVRDDEFQPLADRRQLAARLQIHGPELVAVLCIQEARP